MLKLLQNDTPQIELANGEKTSLREIPIQEDGLLKSNKMPYEYKIMNEKILYLRYSRCYDNERLPFQTLVNQIKNEIKGNGIKNYILDVRGNSGGNSEILNPFQQLVDERKMNGCLLIDNGVFSSGRFAVARFKKAFNATLIGEPTGGAAKSYGYVKPLEIEGKKFSASIRLWDFSDIFGYEGAIQPDILVRKTIQDMQEQRDPVLNKAIEVIIRNEYIQTDYYL